MTSTSCYASVISRVLVTHTSCYASVISRVLVTHTSCYASVISLVLVTHTSCYASVISLVLVTHTSCYASVISLVLVTHTSCYASVSYLVLVTHTSCYASVISLVLVTHTSCYASVPRSTGGIAGGTCLLRAWGWVTQMGLGRERLRRVWRNPNNDLSQSNKMYRYHNIMYHHRYILMFYDGIFLHRITFELVGFVPSIVVDMSCTNAFV